MIQPTSSPIIRTQHPSLAVGKHTGSKHTAEEAEEGRLGERTRGSAGVADAGIGVCLGVNVGRSNMPRRWLERTLWVGTVLRLCVRACWIVRSCGSALES